MGGSLGMALRKKLGFYVIGVVRRKKTGEIALEKGAVDKWTLSIEEGVKEADYVFFATPVGSIVPLFKKALSFFKKGALISDLGSTKKNIVYGITPSLREDLAFIGGHPMTGSEKKGVENAVENLYDGAPYILTPVSPFDRERTEELISIVKAIGSTPYIMNPEEHDTTVSLISHVPYILSISLVSLLDRFPLAEKLVAGNFRDLTRPALSDPIMWKDIILNNREEIKKTLTEVYKNAMKVILKDENEIEQALRKALSVREKLFS